MPTTFADLTDQLRIGLGLTPQQAAQLILRIVPTLEISALSDVSTAASGANDALGRAFIAGVAAQFSHGQLFNPANSGNILLCRQVIGVSDITTDMNIARHDVALTTLGTGKDWADFRRSGNPVGEMRSQTDAGGFGTTIYTARVQSDSFFLVTFPSPLVLAPGQGVLIRHRVFASELSASFFWTEERTN